MHMAGVRQCAKRTELQRDTVMAGPSALGAYMCKALRARSCYRLLRMQAVARWVAHAAVWLAVLSPRSQEATWWRRHIA